MRTFILRALEGDIGEVLVEAMDPLAAARAVDEQRGVAAIGYEVQVLEQPGGELPGKGASGYLVRSQEDDRLVYVLRTWPRSSAIGSRS